MKTFLKTRLSELETTSVSRIRRDSFLPFEDVVAEANNIHKYEKCLIAIDKQMCQTIEIRDVRDVIRDANGIITYLGEVLDPQGRIVRKRYDDGCGARVFYTCTPIRRLNKSVEYFRPCSLWMAHLLGVDYYNCTDISLGNWFKLPTDRKIYAHISK